MNSCYCSKPPHPIDLLSWRFHSVEIGNCLHETKDLLWNNCISTVMVTAAFGSPVCKIHKPWNQTGNFQQTLLVSLICMVHSCLTYSSTLSQKLSGRCSVLGQTDRKARITNTPLLNGLNNRLIIVVDYVRLLLCPNFITPYPVRSNEV